jgi:hypothetical protein
MRSKWVAHHRAVLTSALEELPTLEARVRDKLEDQSGCFTSMLSINYRIIGTRNFFLESDVDSFRANLAKSAELRLGLFQRFEAGEPIDPSYVSILGYMNLLDALAAGRLQLASDLAQIIGGRPEIEKKFDHPFDRAFGYALKAVVLSQNVTSSLEILKHALTKKGTQLYRGFGDILESIEARDETGVNRGLTKLAAEYPAHTKKAHYARIDPDLCVWGIGLANLAASRGLAFRAESPLIPAILVISAEATRAD